MRPVYEIPLYELGASCIYCGRVVASFTGFVLGGAWECGIELRCHDRCGAILSPDQLASYAAIRTIDQIRRGYYTEELNNHGAMFEKATKEAHMPVIVKDEIGPLLDDLFTYHPPTDEQRELYAQINESAKAFAATVMECCPKNPDAIEAIRLIRMARMTANSAIATKSGGALPWTP